jgi:hypothetical protein
MKYPKVMEAALLGGTFLAISFGVYNRLLIAEGVASVFDDTPQTGAEKGINNVVPFKLNMKCEPMREEPPVITRCSLTEMDSLRFTTTRTVCYLLDDELKSCEETMAWTEDNSD